MLEAVASWQRQHGRRKEDELRGAWLLGGGMAVPAVVVPPALVSALAPMLWLPPDVVHVLEPDWLNMLVSLPLAMVVGAITASLGTVLGDIWNWNER
jgi:hypothetical protein